ncbi:MULTISPECIES: CoA transferase [Bacillaceae]|uniref:CaiB/BaiF CoA transferase family protein n=1 Tax=Bacillaceae TaxID=186817 RepID=UPI0006FD0134|nr:MULTISPECIES: CoA transferase [Bacillaceae]KQL35729.1 acetyl-CoA acetyltransferase [Psychrobacillus sp. FJAT-21963]MDF2067129.1 CoA transferase [Bacillus sp. Cr_A10]
MSGPLEGIRVLDLTSVVMGPYCTLMLADMGADVIKIESPSGDTTRYLGPSKNRGMGSLFLHLNRNKRSVTLDLKSKDGLETMMALVKDADVLVHTMRPKTMERLGLSYEHLRKVNSQLIYCGMYGFSKEGPYGDKPAYDDIIQAASGIVSAQGKVSGSPQYLATVLADKTAGLVGLSSILAALLYRQQKGVGQEIEVPMFETMVSYNMIEHMYGETFIPAKGSTYYSRVTSPYRKPYKTKDGYIGVMIYNDKQWKSFFEVSGHQELAADERFVDMEVRTQNIDYVYSMIEEIIAEKTTETWLYLLVNADIPCTNINTPDDLFKDTHLNDINFFRTVHHPTEGEIRDMKFPVTFSETPVELSRYAPNLGEHNEELLKGLQLRDKDGK